MGDNIFSPNLGSYTMNEWLWNNNYGDGEDRENKKKEYNPNDIEYDPSDSTGLHEPNAPASEPPPHDPADPTKPRISPSKPTIMRELKYIIEWYNTSY
jgi:hypothetical protein